MRSDDSFSVYFILCALFCDGSSLVVDFVFGFVFVCMWTSLLNLSENIDTCGIVERLPQSHIMGVARHSNSCFV